MTVKASMIIQLKVQINQNKIQKDITLPPWQKIKASGSSKTLDGWNSTTGHKHLQGTTHVKKMTYRRKHKD